MFRLAVSVVNVVTMLLLLSLKCCYLMLLLQASVAKCSTAPMNYSKFKEDTGVVLGQLHRCNKLHISY